MLPFPEVADLELPLSFGSRQISILYMYMYVLQIR